MYSTYSIKVRELFTKGSLHRNISLVLISQNISLNSKYIAVFKNPSNKTRIGHLALQVNLENISSFHKMYLEALNTHVFIYSCI